MAAVYIMIPQGPRSIRCARRRRRASVGQLASDPRWSSRCNAAFHERSHASGNLESRIMPRPTSRNSGGPVLQLRAPPRTLIAIQSGNGSLRAKLGRRTASSCSFIGDVNNWKESAMEYA